MSPGSPNDLHRFVRDKLRQRNTYAVALVVGTLINGYGHILVPWLRGTAHPLDTFIAELIEHPSVNSFSLVIAYFFPVLVDLYSSVATRFDQRDHERLASFPEHNPNPVIELEVPGGRVSYANAQARQQFPTLERAGLEHPIVAGLPALMEEMDQHALESHKREATLGDRTYVQRIVYLRNMRLMRFYVTDVTELRETEKNLRRLASFPEKNPNPVIETTLTGRTTYLNPLARERFPDLEQETAEHPVLAGLAEIVDRLKQRQEPSITREVTVRDLIYEQRIVYLRESHLIRLFLHDVTSLKELQRRIQQNLLDLERSNKDLRDAQVQLVQSEKMAALGMLVAGIAHEINTPIGAIASTHDTLMRAATKMSAITEAIAAEEATTKQVKAIALVLANASDVIRVASTRITEIVTKMRNFARLDEAEQKRVDVHDGITSTLRMLSHKTQGRIEIITEFGDVPSFICYPGRLNQAFLALLMNAIQAIQGPGRIWIRTAVEGENVRITIRDDGVGIPPENIPKIFDPGFTTKGVGVGTGLGLSICRQTIQIDHKGRIGIESTPGKGTTVEIVLPLSPNGS